MKPYARDTWIEVDLDAIAANVSALRQHIPAHSEIMAVVKADGYGHGSEYTAREALAHGATRLAVAALDEALVLRRAGITAPILVLGYTPVDAMQTAVEENIQLTVYHLQWLHEAANLLVDSSHQLEVHVKVDTGMGRIGVSDEAELLELIHAITTNDSMRWVGIFTHFACADEEDTTHVKGQHALFQERLKAVEKAGYKLPLIHCNNTAAAIVFPEWSYDLIRLGIGLYGLYPSDFIKQQHTLDLRSALSLKTRISHVKNMPPHSTVSYGATYTTTDHEQIATVPIGYGDGFSRLLSNRGVALCHGKRVPIVGRVCMDQTILHIHSGDAQVGDEVVLYGKQGNEEITLDEIAECLGTINYEVTCMLNYRIPRVYLRNGKIVGICHGIANKFLEEYRKMAGI
ncbi:alanine racemase [Brevibacillus laterosporus]|uniref:alanine racemase n=1 Tax=Brevibacillus laterosporus TaxID=1465 RepID=UPI0018CF87C5|nr:alanine racemase [Brevibacillus laterosporus]MBG9797307.1 alanine racemase [Brevibacillus laterosporus]MED1912599.1 alanine racemase [Brevibacillus laterosporus]